MTKRKVSIEIGHGGADPGAVRGNIREKDINLTVGLELKRHLERHGVEVLINRTTDVSFKVADFRNAAAKFAPDVGLSVHTNAFNGKAFGFEVFRNTNSFKQVSSLLCAGIEREVKALGQHSRGVKDSPFMMSTLNCPTAYLELGFLDNPDDYKNFDTPEKQRAFGAAYAKGVLDFLAIDWRDENAAPEKAEKTPDSPNVQDSPSQNSGTADAGAPAETVFRVVAGSFAVRANADAQVRRLKAAGFDSFIVANTIS